MSEDDLYQAGILELCQRLHMSKTGASDPLDDDDVKATYMAYLQQRIDSWKPVNIRKSTQYDICVYWLVKAALTE